MNRFRFTQNNRRPLTLILVPALVFTSILAASSPVVAQQFRVENRVFEGMNEKPEIETTTLFNDSIVYDYIGQDGEITIYDTERERLILLDPESKVRAEVSCDEIREFIHGLRERANRQESSFIRFMANPQFQTTFDEETSTLRLTSPLVTYRVTTEPTEESMANAYQRFTDWSSLLSTTMLFGAAPPFARMQLNAEMASRQLFPKEVYLTLRPGGASIMSRPIMRRSEHSFREGLTESELQRIAATGRQMASFEKISFDEYMRHSEGAEEE